MSSTNHVSPLSQERIQSPSLFWLLFSTLSAASIVPIWLCEYFPSMNGPSLLHISYVLRELGNQELGYSSFFDLHLFPVPYLLQTTGLNLLFCFFSPIVADKLWISLVVLLRPLALVYLLRQLGRGRELYVLASFLLVYDFCLMRGYYNYHAGVSIGLLILGYYVKHHEGWRFRSTVTLNLLVLLHYFTHPVALATTGVLLAAYEFAKSRSPARIFGIVLRAYIPSLILLTAFMVWCSRYGAWVEPHVGFLTIPDKIQNVFFRGTTPLSTAANLMSVALLGSILTIGMFRLFNTHGTFRFRKMYVNANMFVHEPMLVVLATAFLLYLLMPWDLIGWHKADVRIIPVLCALALCVPRAITHRRIRAVFMGVATTITLVGLLLCSRTLCDWSREVAEYVGGVQAIPTKSRILPISAQPTKSDRWKLSYAIDPVHRADSYYCMARGGASGNSLARNNTLYWIWYKDYRNLSAFPKVDAADPTPEQIEAAARSYDAVLVWRAGDRFAPLFAEHGFTTAFQQGRLTVLTKQEDEESTIERVTLK